MHMQMNKFLNVNSLDIYFLKCHLDSVITNSGENAIPIS